MSPRQQDASGESLVEILIAVFILGFVGVAVLGALATGIAGSSQHRRQASALTLIASGAEYIERSGPTGACAPLAAPGASDVQPSPGLQVAITGPFSASGGACSPLATLQMFTVTVTNQQDGSLIKSLNVLVGRTT